MFKNALRAVVKWVRRTSTSPSEIEQIADEVLPRKGESTRAFTHRKWMELPIGQRNRIIKYLRDDPDFMKDVPMIRKAMADDPEGWLAQYHMHWGMGIRNYLRGIYRDTELPTGNWDDYYGPAVEAAVRNEHYVT
jgi:hypothetical protein